MKRVLNYLGKNSERVLVVCISVFATFITSIQLFAQLLRKPNDSVFVGLPLYWEDYYFYLDQFFQGAHGQWLVTNKFSVEHQTPSLLYFFNLLLGKIGGFFGLEPYTSFHVSTIVLKFLFIILSYYVISLIIKKRFSRFAIFLIFLFSTTFPLFNTSTEGSLTIQTARVFRSENTIFARFGNLPDGMIRNILFLLSFILFYKLSLYIHDLFQNTEKISFTKIPKNYFLRLLAPLTIVLFFLTLDDATKSVIMLSSTTLLTALCLPKQNRFQYFITWLYCLAILFIPSLFLLLYLNSFINSNPVYVNALQWDISEHIKQLNILENNPLYTFASVGTLGIFFFIGLIPFIKRINSLIDKYILTIIFVSIIGFFSPIYLIAPIPGFRFIFSSTYIFFAIIAYTGITTINKLFGGKIIYIILSLYFIPSIITYSNSLRRAVQPLKEPLYHFAYIPNNLYKGFMYLRNAQPENAVAIATPDSSLDMILPGLTGKKTYSGHLLMTPNNKEKDKIVMDFFYNWTDPSVAKNFLLSNSIRYVMWTKYDGDVRQIEKDYPFLQTVFKNDMVSIFTY